MMTKITKTSPREISSIREQAASQNLGDFLREKIAAFGIPAEDIRARVRVSHELWRAFLAGNFSKVSADPYTKHAIFRIADFLGMSGEELWERFLEEKGGGVSSSGAGDKLPQTSFRQKGFSWRTSIWRTALMGGFVLLIALLVFWATRFWWLGPSISITSPAQEWTRVDAQDITISGTVVRASKLLINDNTVNITQNSFSVAAPLRPGTNVFEIAARDRFGREARIVRYVLRE